MNTLTRRMLVLSGGTSLLGATVYGGSLLSCSQRSSAAAQRLGDPTRLFAVLDDMPAPAAVAEAVLAGRTPIALRTLLVDLAASDPIRSACGLDCPATRRASLQQAFREEFRTGAHTIAAGWIVSSSEARIAALWATTIA